MKRFVILILLLNGIVGLFSSVRAIAQEADYPSRPSVPINDFGNLLSPQNEARLDRLSRDLLDRTGAAVVVATVETIAPETIEEYATKLFERWGIGRKGKDEGVLILVAVKERKVRIEVGYGLEGTIPDAKASRIIRQIMLPDFRKGNFGTGIVLGTQAIAGLIAEEVGVEIEGVDRKAIEAGTTRKRSRAPKALGIFIVILIFALITIIRSVGSGRGRGSGY
ncbi:MAG: TPM domain-containing protein, partial [Candidatus Euphemobacter frigidus]|nr:TPM domain-containing protein [Candidatus Euphemobacter frigidus]